MRGSILIYAKTDSRYEIRKNRSISDKVKEILTIEIICKESKNMLLSCCYRPPEALKENLTFYLTYIFQRVLNQEKISFIIGDFNLNCLNYNDGSNIKHFYHKVLELGFLPPIDKPKRVCINRAMINKAITKSNISDHFPFIFTIQTGKNQSKCQTLVHNKKKFNRANKATFKQHLCLLHW